MRLNRRVEKFSREAWARIVGGAKSCTPASTSAPTACLDSLSPSIDCAHRAQPRDRVGDVDGQRPAHGRDAVAELAAARPAVRIDTGTSARSSSPSVRTPRAAQPVAQRAADDGEHDVVDRAAERVLDQLEVVEVAADDREAAVRADLDVQRRRRAPGSAPAQAISPTPSTRLARVAQRALGAGERAHRAPCREPAARAHARRARRAATSSARRRLGVRLPGRVGVRHVARDGVEVEEHRSRGRRPRRRR